MRGIAGGKGLERLCESGGEIEAAREVFDAVAFISAEVAHFDEIVDDGPDVFSLMNAPLLEDDEGHGAKFGEGVLADAFKELLAGDVLVILAFTEDFGCHVEGFADKIVGSRVEARIFGNGLSDGELEMDV